MTVDSTTGTTAEQNASAIAQRLCGKSWLGGRLTRREELVVIRGPPTQHRPFVLGHAMALKAIYGSKTKNDRLTIPLFCAFPLLSSREKPFRALLDEVNRQFVFAILLHLLASAFVSYPNKRRSGY